MTTGSTAVPERAPLSRVLLSFILCVAALAGGFGGCTYLAGLKQPPAVRAPEARRFNVEVFQVERADVQELILGFGTAHADREVVLSAQVAGEVLQIHPRLRVGESMEPPHVSVNAAGESQRQDGDLLVSINPETYQEKLEQVEGRIAEAEADLDRLKQVAVNLDRLLERSQADFEDSKSEYQKIVGLRDKGIATDSDVRRAQLELRQYERANVTNRNEHDLLPIQRIQTQRRLESLQNELKLARLDLQRTTVRPPFAGHLSQVHVEKGQYLKPGDPLVTLVDNDVVEIPVAVTLDDYARLLPEIQAGRPPVAAIAPHETAAPVWQGAVVRAAPQADEHSRTVMVFVHVENREQATPLLPGTFVHVRIDGPILTQRILIPRDAVLNSRGFVIRDGKAEPRTVTIARTLNALAEITQGLEPGEKLALSNLDSLYDGARVTARAGRTFDEELARMRTPVVRKISNP